jgi:fucose permease
VTSTASDLVVRRAVRATYITFVGSGFAFANWAARIPQVRDRLHLSPSELGLVLLAIAVGSVLALPLAGPIVTRFGPRRTVAVMAGALAIGLAGVAVGYLIGVTPVVVGLLLVGFGNGAWDVAMNVHATVVERQLGKAIMSRFHAGWSLGTVAGALLGAAMVALQVPVTAHLAVVAVAVGIWVPRSTHQFLSDAEPADSDRPETSDSRRALQAWREPRTLVVGVFVLAFAFAEGVGNDWIGIALIDGYGVTAAIGTLGFAVFLAAMMLGRWFGPALLDRYGRVPIVRTGAAVGAVGTGLFIFGQFAGLAFLGCLLWGVGTSLGFPVGMSAGGDDPAMAAGRVSVIASIGYCAFLAGPPLIGFLGDRITVLRAILTVAMLLAVSVLLAGAVRRPSGPSA